MANPNAAVYPDRAATDADLYVLHDNAITGVASAIGIADAAIEVASTLAFPSPCIIRIEQEIVICPNAPVVNVWHGVTRGAFGTAASAHPVLGTDGNPTPVYGYYFATLHNQLAAEVKAIEAALVANPPAPAIHFVDNETPAIVNGTHFTLAHAPSPAAGLILFRNGLMQQQGAGKDYTLAGANITSALDWTGSVLIAFYRY
jgi:hypothetical protein